MNLLTETHQELSSYLSQLENLKQQMDFILKNFRPVFDGEVFLSGKEVCELLHITKRTLQQYRDDGLFPQPQRLSYTTLSCINNNTDKHFL